MEVRALISHMRKLRPESEANTGLDPNSLLRIYLLHTMSTHMSNPRFQPTVHKPTPDGKGCAALHRMYLVAVAWPHSVKGEAMTGGGGRMWGKSRSSAEYKGINSLAVPTQQNALRRHTVPYCFRERSV